MSPKDADGIANSVDYDQTAPLSLIWIYTVCPDLSVWKLRNITLFTNIIFLGSFVWATLCSNDIQTEPMEGSALKLTSLGIYKTFKSCEILLHC